jgi:excinuclease ABC subunit B
MDETGRRREVQAAHNEAHGITPRSIVKSVEEIRFSTAVADARERQPSVFERGESYADLTPDELVDVLEKEMRAAAGALDFENAARLRDELFEIKAKLEGARDRSPRSRVSALAPTAGSGRALTGRKP